MWKNKFIAILVGLLFAVDFAGVPLAVIAFTHSESATNKAERNTAALVQARKEDCQAAEAIRRRVRLKVKEERAQLPATVKLLHIVLTPALKTESETKFKLSEEEARSVNCTMYADRGRK